VVVDDGSTDGTRELLAKMQNNDQNFSLIFTGHRTGLAKSIWLGINSCNSKWVAVMDTDGMHDPAYLSVMFAAALDGSKLVIGSRYVEGGHSQGAIYPRFSRVVNHLVQYIMKSKVKDQLCGFFIADLSEIKKISSDSFVGFGEYFIGLVNHFERNNFPIIEIGTVHRIRDAGLRKSKRFRMLKSYIAYALMAKR
jgi:glycosyltransferase involved in cell wall biosynthesis